MSATLQATRDQSGALTGMVIPVATTNGLMLTHSGLAGAAGFGISAEWTEE